MYDCALLLSSVSSSEEHLKGGLQRVAEELSVPRSTLAEHLQQAGSDSALTSAIFFKLRKAHFSGRIDDSRFRCALYGMGPHAPALTAH